jgi:uncharacterized membrane protein
MTIRTATMTIAALATAVGLTLGIAAAAVTEMVSSGRGSGRLEVARCNGGDCRGEFPETAPQPDRGWVG